MDADMKMAKCRKNLDWNGQIAMSLNPDKVREWRAEVPPTETGGLQHVRRVLRDKDC